MLNNINHFTYSVSILWCYTAPSVTSIHVLTVSVGVPVLTGTLAVTATHTVTGAR